ncbi:MAG: nucleotide exchange factor GrpE [Desulfuromonadaceae bacterium]|nr:nucleotide exchange factor GrpE [Desulfuromonadaceae bacterium]
MAEKKETQARHADGAEIAEGEILAQENTEGAAQDMVAATELQACKDELAQMKDQFLRARADMENYRRRMQREKEETIKFANEGILKEMLPVMDNLDRAITHARTHEEQGSSLLDGIEMIQRQMYKVLEKHRVAPIDALDCLFDSACHEAMGQCERDDCPPNTVVEEMQRGYMLNDRLLRPSMVMVSKNSAEKKSE